MDKPEKLRNYKIYLDVRGTPTEIVNESLDTQGPGVGETLSLDFEVVRIRDNDSDTYAIDVKFIPKQK